MPTHSPFLPIATLQEVLAYNPSDASTHTASPLVNAVAEVLYSTHVIEASELAELLSLDQRKLSGALQIELGMSLRDVIKHYRIHAIQTYISQHPEATLQEVARENGYASDNAIWRLFLRHLGTTPNGTESTSEKLEWIEKVRLLNAKR